MSGGYLLLRRGGVLWGIDNAVVTGLTRRGASYRISLGEASLSADEVLCVVDDLAVQPAAALRRFWPGVGPGVTGLAVHGEQPLVIVDPLRPPELLWLDEGADGGDTADGER
ncbi:MAG: hypothetical protein QOH06_929 [Acidobacteriota bacterium]|jgi:hypothetical protein|nr:hypothetical protein [Acidobacteriota bacterium]